MNNVSTSEELLRLSSLIVDTFEIGARKAELDVSDEICNFFNIDLAAIEDRYRSPFRKGLNDRQQKRLRMEVAQLLAERVGSPEVLITVVARSGSKFLEMVDEIYALLSKHKATSNRPAEKFRFRKNEVDLDLVLSDAFLERVRRIRKIVTSVETGTIDEDKLNKLLNVDGDYNGQWPIAPDTSRANQKTCNIGRELSYLAWLKEELDQTSKDLTEAKRLLQITFDAASRFVGQAMVLVAAHVNSLKNSTDIGNRHDVNSVNDHKVRAGLIEQLLFRERGWLGSGLYASEFGLSQSQDSLRLYVDVSQLISSPNTPGSSPNCITLHMDINDSSYGTPVSRLAGLCGIWKTGVRRAPDERHDNGLRDALYHNDELKVVAWLTNLASSLDAASEWIRKDVWESNGNVPLETLIDEFEEFLNLPLWRHRWLLYEIWLIAVTIGAAESHGWISNLQLISAGDETWILPVNDFASSPCAVLHLPHSSNSNLELWYQDCRRRNGVEIKPDLSIETPVPLRRDLVIVEGKDRYRMPARGKNGAKAVGNEYYKAAGAHVTWIVNYCPFEDAQLSQPETNYGDAWHELHYGSGFKPGNVPDCFLRSIGRALLPLHLAGVDNKRSEARVLTCVLDTTGSMRQNFDEIWIKLRNAIDSPLLKSYFSEYCCILFGDHDPDVVDPYVVIDSGLHTDFEELVKFANKQPLCNGGDRPEALEDAMRACNEFAGKVSRPTSFLIFTDAPPHTVSDCPHQINFHDEVAKLLRNGNYCLVIEDWMDESARKCWRAFESNPLLRWIKLDNLLDVLSHLGRAIDA